MGPPRQNGTTRVQGGIAPRPEETESVPGRREQLIREKQDELGTLLDKHDDLVCLYHLSGLKTINGSMSSIRFEKHFTWNAS